MPSNLVLSTFGFTVVMSKNHGRYPTGSLANIVLVWFGLLASLGVPSLVAMTWGVFLLGLVCVPC